MTTSWYPNQKASCWNPFRSIKFFVFCQGFLQLAQLMVSGCLKSSVSTIERRYGFTSQELGLLVAFNEVGNVMLIMFVSFFGSRVHRPRLIGAGALLASVSSLIIALPHFLSRPYQFAAHPGISTNNLTTGLCQSRSSFATLASNHSCVNSEGQTQQGVFPVMLLGQLLLGISTVPIQPFGMSYVDDYASRRNSPFYIGILLAVTSLGPAAGFMMGSFTLRFYVDFDKTPADQIQIDSKDLRWVGAWWLGFLIASCLLFLTSLPYLFFPRTMAQESVTPAEEAKSKEEKQLEVVQTASLKQFLKSFPRIFLRTLQNPVFMLMCLGQVFCAGVIVGVVTFLAKFMERQFNLTASYATMLIGVVHMPVCVAAIVIGGAVMRRLDLSRSGAAKWCSLAIVCTLFVSVPLLFIGCPTQRVAGVFPTSRDGSEAVCSGRCECPQDAFNPVCASDGTEFRSPCHAGCIAMETDSSSHKVQNYTSCGCVTGGGGSALPGTCGSRCAHLLVVFMVLSALTCFIGPTCKAPCFSTILRSVPPEDKSFAVGVCYMLFRVLAFLPTPVIYGSVIDSSCILWGRKCGKKTSCQYYDLDSFRHRFFSLLTMFLCLALFCFLMTILVLRKQAGRLDKKQGSEREYKLVGCSDGVSNGKAGLDVVEGGGGQRS
ncbi:solute carrier organic anion transporter family member 2B1 [Gadus chalcogrammus]|uniref:solute carrier organic anion transporter family member 2B1 n=1 Tax=Gadus chalcogrammus TaxID=1042646 RepID=UPI0024C24A04|nr:solute carrier organic anion transporter family member 2B1 [Gadus chalcogrammus]